MLLLFPRHLRWFSAFNVGTDETCCIERTHHLTTAPFNVLTVHRPLPSTTSHPFFSFSPSISTPGRLASNPTSRSSLVKNPGCTPSPTFFFGFSCFSGPLPSP